MQPPLSIPKSTSPMPPLCGSPPPPPPPSPAGEHETVHWGLSGQSQGMGVTLHFAMQSMNCLLPPTPAPHCFEASARTLLAHSKAERRAGPRLRSRAKAAGRCLGNPVFFGRDVDSLRVFPIANS